MTNRPPSTSAGPPRIAAWIISRVARALTWRETALGDLHEEFDAVRAADGPRPARAWYRRQAALLTVELLTARVRGGLSALATFIRPSGDQMMQSLARDTRRAVRSLRRQPMVTSIIIGTLALGLGANAATFGMIDRLLLRPFSIPNVDQLVVVSELAPTDVFPGDSVSPANFLDWREQTDVVRQIAAFHWWDVNLSGGDQPERVQGHRVSAGFFPLLGVTAALGRLLTTDDEVFGEHRRVVLSNGLWQRRFGGDPDVVGRTVHLDGEAYEVVGVAEPAFDFPNATEVWAPVAFESRSAVSRSDRFLTVAGRLSPGMTVADAQAALETTYERQREQYPDDIRDRALVVEPFTAAMVDVGLPRVLALWQAAALMVLLIGCVNVANLLLARGAERARELAVRIAIGAGRAHLLRQLLVESLVLSVAAVPAALFVAWTSFVLVKAAMPATLVRFVPGFQEMGVDGRVVVFTLAAATATALAFGLLPALRSSRPALNSTLRDGGRSVSAGAARSRLRRGLVVAQVAVALPLLVLSGLSAVGASRLANGPQGYNPDGVLRMRTRLPAATYSTSEAQSLFVDRLLDRAAEVPGATIVATSSTVPSSTSNWSREVFVDGVPIDPDSQAVVNFRSISPRYFDVMEIPLLQGRGFTSGDRGDTELVAIVSQSMARRYWPDESPLGKRVGFTRTDTEWFRVVGVSGDTIDDWFAYRGAPTVFVPAPQLPSNSVYLVARTTGDPTTIVAGLQTAITDVDPTQAAFEIASMREAIRERTTGLRFISALMMTFGLLALVLASFGIYGVMAHYVAQRHHEIGVRMALGASAAIVLRQTMGHGAKLAGVGIVIGTGLGVVLARLMESALFGVVALEPSLFVTIATAMALVALVASLVPAHHATRIDPISAIRGE